MKKSSVLVLTDYGTPEKLLLKALENGHQVTVVETAVEAMKELEKRKNRPDHFTRVSRK